MNDDYFNNQLNEVYNEPQIEQPFEKDQDISRHLLSVAKYKSRAINEDSPRANNNPLELQATRSAARVINRCEYAEKRFGWNLTDLIEFFEGTRAITEVTGRGKNMAVGFLTKSNINIQQAEQMVRENQIDYQEEAEQSIQEKVASKIPFLKKKEL
jgi:hypothetical protein